MNRLFKSPQEKEMDRRMQVKQGRRRIERHISTQKKQVQRYWEMAKQAYQLEDTKVLAQLVRLISQTRRAITIWERRLLYFDMIEAQRDQALASADFAQAFKAMSETILTYADPSELNKIQLDLERSAMVAEAMEDRLEDFMESMDDMLGEATSAEEKAELSEIMRMIQTEAEQAPKAAVDDDIDATMKQIEALLGRAA